MRFNKNTKTEFITIIYFILNLAQKNIKRLRALRIKDRKIAFYDLIEGKEVRVKMNFDILDNIVLLYNPKRFF